MPSWLARRASIFGCSGTFGFVKLTVVGQDHLRIMSMDANLFEYRPLSCPVCHRGLGHPARPLGEQFARVFWEQTEDGRSPHQGLLICQHCRQRVVVSWSGHYVRDPFILQKLAMGRSLRRQSRPLARILRDVGLARHSSIWAIVGGLILLGLTFSMAEGPLLPELPKPESWGTPAPPS